MKNYWKRISIVAVAMLGIAVGASAQKKANGKEEQALGIFYLDSTDNVISLEGSLPYRILGKKHSYLLQRVGLTQSSSSDKSMQIRYRLKKEIPFTIEHSEDGEQRSLIWQDRLTDQTTIVHCVAPPTAKQKSFIIEDEIRYGAGSTESAKEYYSRQSSYEHGYKDLVDGLNPDAAEGNYAGLWKFLGFLNTEGNTVELTRGAPHNYKIYGKDVQLQLFGNLEALTNDRPGGEVSIIWRPCQYLAEGVTIEDGNPCLINWIGQDFLKETYINKSTGESVTELWQRIEMPASVKKLFVEELNGKF